MFLDQISFLEQIWLSDQIAVYLFCNACKRLRLIELVQHSMGIF